uniref:Ferritin n=1 Tax=Hemiscolopendra marginata TaxID=943146 RepID=A0A646QHE3_9MYRI
MISVVVPAFFLVIFLSVDISQVRANANIMKVHHLSDELATLLQQQVGEELKAANNYLALAAYFGEEKVNRPGFAKFFKENAEEEFEHAQKIIDYLNKRGKALEPSNLHLEPPLQTKWKDGLHAMHYALEMEGRVTEKLNTIHNNGSKDGHLTNFLESEFLEEQVNSMRRLSGYVRNLHDMIQGGNPSRNSLAEYLFDLQLQKQKDEL